MTDILFRLIYNWKILLWPDELKKLPMDDSHKNGLISHWKNLYPDFRVNS